jgi:hypothetical protein
MNISLEKNDSISFDDICKFNRFVSSRMGSKSCSYLPGINKSLSDFLTEKGYDKVKLNTNFIKVD